MSLLTDEEMLGVFTSYDSSFDYVGGTEGDLAWEVAKAQHAKDFKTLAEWLGGFCIYEGHHKQASRMYCPVCMVEFYYAALKGKIPGEAG
ncbi:hypothetical protein LCGC14_1655060 [marine sediment metagenome]|uniref:Uncharacterized protein n=1 Tax=marine sediment metagenome TaxID=412755 RepID=A0A0F9KBI2_9ZZZZ